MSSCQRDKEFEYRLSALMLKSLADAALAPTKAELAKHLMQPVAAGDCMHLLLRGLYACWSSVPQVEREYLLPQMVLAHLQYSASGYAWLAEQHLHVAHRLVRALKEAPPHDSHSRRGVDRVSVPPLPKRTNLDGLWSNCSISSRAGSWRFKRSSNSPKRRPSEPLLILDRSGSCGVWRQSST